VIFHFLSHPLSPATPAYGGGSGMTIETTSTIAQGDSSNTQRWTLSNHLGTHVDAPRHFVESGKNLDDYDASFWRFTHPCLVDIPAMAGELLGPDQLRGKFCNDCDLLLIRTGFEDRRNTESYWSENPGLHPDLADWLRENHGTVRAVGLDTISISSWTDRQTGRVAHRHFLEGESPILLIEDMKLSAFVGPVSEVVIAPLIVVGADGAPCTVFAISENNV
tara:strand:- start:506 stop:1168 length:663 start_codon:yes stop_codon:yes gene_type:complete